MVVEAVGRARLQSCTPQRIMLDIIALVILAAMFGLSLIYVKGCDHLRGTRP